jgi:hypothetical protein
MKRIVEDSSANIQEVRHCDKTISNKDNNNAISVSAETVPQDEERIWILF